MGVEGRLREGGGGGRVCNVVWLTGRRAFHLLDWTGLDGLYYTEF